MWSINQNLRLALLLRFVVSVQLEKFNNNLDHHDWPHPFRVRTAGLGRLARNFVEACLCRNNHRYHQASATIAAPLWLQNPLATTGLQERRKENCIARWQERNSLPLSHNGFASFFGRISHRTLG